MILFIFLFGICIGSFLNVVIDRMPNGQSIIWGRSWCDHCKKTLQWFDLIPLLSFIMLAGKCRYCHTPLSFQYPAMELLTGGLFVVTFILLNQQGIMNQEFPLRQGFEGQVGIMDFITLAYHLLIVSSLITIFFIDLKYGIIPDKILLFMLILTLFYLFLIPNSLFIIHVLSAIGACSFFLLIYLATKGRGMGFGDVKFAFIMGLILGFPKIIPSLYIAFLTGAFVSIILVVSGRKKLKGSTIPFGPFLVIGMLIGMFIGDKILQKFFFYTTLL